MIKKLIASYVLVAATLILTPLTVQAGGANGSAVPRVVANDTCASGKCDTIAPFNKCCDGTDWQMGTLCSSGDCGSGSGCSVE